MSQLYRPLREEWYISGQDDFDPHTVDLSCLGFEIHLRNRLCHDVQEAMDKETGNRKRYLLLVVRRLAREKGELSKVRRLRQDSTP